MQNAKIRTQHSSAYERTKFKIVNFVVLFCILAFQLSVPTRASDFQTGILIVKIKSPLNRSYLENYGQLELDRKSVV